MRIILILFLAILTVKSAAAQDSFFSFNWYPRNSAEVASIRGRLRKVGQPAQLVQAINQCDEGYEQIAHNARSEKVRPLFEDSLKVKKECGLTGSDLLPELYALEWCTVECEPKTAISFLEQIAEIHSKCPDIVGEDLLVYEEALHHCDGNADKVFSRIAEAAEKTSTRYKQLRFLQLSDRLFERKRYSEALSALEKASASPNCFPKHLLDGRKLRIHVMSNDPTEAVKAMKQAPPVFSVTRTGDRVLLCSFALTASSTDDPRLKFEAVYDRSDKYEFPQDLVGTIDDALTCEQEGNFERAVSDYKKIMNLHGPVDYDSMIPVIGLARTLTRAGKYQELIPLLQYLIT